MASANPHHRSVVFAVAAVIFIFMAGGLVMIEIIAALSTRAENERKAVGQPPRTGYWGLVASAMTGPAPKVLRKRALLVMAVSGVIALVALIV